MKTWMITLCLLAASATANASPDVWQPTAGHTQVPLWPGTPPNAKAMPGPEYVRTGTSLLGGKTVVTVSNVSQPTMTVYPPKGTNTGAAVVVFPGGGFEILAMDLEGTEACDWLTSRGVTCVLLKYRVPSLPYVPDCDCRPHNLALSMPSLQDAQRTMRLVRSHAAQWGIDPHKIGVLGFSAGGFLAAEISTVHDRTFYAPVDGADKESARPDFAILVYPGHLATDDDKANPALPITARLPPSFLVQAEDDDTDGVHQTLVYYAALAKKHVPAELHLYAHGGHAFGLRQTNVPINGWPAQAEAWMRTIGVIHK